MPKYVVISGGEYEFRLWGQQYANVGPLRENIEFLRSRLTIIDVVDAVERAAKIAGRGWVIFNVGHGGAHASSTSIGFVDLAPQGLLRIDNYLRQSRGSIQGTQGRRVYTSYERIGESLRRHRVNCVVFLSCNVGNAMGFVDQIADDWKVEVLAYRRKIVAVIDNEGHARIHFEGERLGQGTNNKQARTRFPLRDPSTYYIGRPGRTRRHFVPSIMRMERREPRRFRLR